MPLPIGPAVSRQEATVEQARREIHNEAVLRSNVSLVLKAAAEFVDLSSWYAGRTNGPVPPRVPAKAETVLVSGAAQEPRTAPFAANASGSISIGEAVEKTRALGVEIPDDVHFLTNDNLVPKGADATYMVPGRVHPSKVYTWESFYNRFGVIPVKVRPEVLESDEHAVAVISHEMFELNHLRRLFAESRSGKMTATELGGMVNAGIDNNLHDRAWNFADEMVRLLRSGGQK